jgi:hypothetical protein
MRALRLVAFLLFVLVFANQLFSQTGTSTIRGTVTDPQGRVVPGASVTLTNQETSATRSMKSGDAGAFVFDLITPGEYRVQVEAKGFKTKAVDNVRALIGKPTESDVQLEIGTSGEVVEVRSSGNEVLVNTQDATLGNNFVSEQITQLPLEARDIRDLLSLQPGATREGYVTGARADQSNVTLDGVDVNNAETGNAAVPLTTNSLFVGQLDTDRGNITTGPVLRLNAEAIDEFRVTTANGNANQGRSSGSQVNLVTKTGTNNWHGAGFEYYRSRGFTANDWFNNHATDANGNPAPVPRPPLQRNTFGGAIGGPIVKNRVFFFYSYEGRHDASSQVQSEVVPLAGLGQGAITYQYCTDAACSSTATNTLTPAQVQAVYGSAPGSPGINPAAVSALGAAAGLFKANDFSIGDGLNTGGFRFNAPTPIKLNSHVAKFDLNLTSKQTAFVRLNVIHDHQALPQWLPNSVSPEVWSHPRGIAAGHTWTIGDNWVNNFRYGFTRQAFTQGGDSFGNDVAFRFVFQPNGETHPVSRITPVHNFTDDVSWLHGRHNIQFGGNVRRISNSRVSFANAFDFATTNPSFYAGGGDHVSTDFQSFLTAQGLPGGQGTQFLSSTAQVQNAATALIGRFSQYNANFTFARNGSLFNSGTPSSRDFATQAYDSYLQDTWKVRSNLTLTLGLRYSLERPVYETQGFEVQPELPLGTFFQDRLAAAAQGQNFSAPVVINLSGPANNGKPMYNWDKNNFQPRIAFAWSHGKSVFRGGFAMTNDYYGEALAVNWDLNNTLGFTSSANINANTYDTRPGTPLAPSFTGFGQDIRSLPNITVPGALKFPLTQPLDEGERIETGVDSTLRAPTEYVWNFTFEHQLPANSVLTVSYIGRAARNLLARRDVMAFNDIKDPKSGMDWYTAGTILEKLRQQGVDTTQVKALPFFENLYPGGLASLMNSVFGLPPDPTQGGFDPTWTNTQTFYAFQSRTPSNPTAFFGGNDWTDTQALIDQVLAPVGSNPLATGVGSPLFMHPQYGALSAWSTVAYSNYNALAVSFRQRLRSLSFDFNYTFAHSLDDASGLQTGGGYASAAFIVNPIRPNTWYGNSTFDVTHNINADVVWQMPFGKGQALLGNAPGAVDAILGGWQMSSIFRWNTGLPQPVSPYDDARWATNWNVQADVTPLNPISSCPNRPAVGTPKLFGGCDITQIYQNFRNAYPGESGPRNYLRLPGFVDLDLGLAKSWKMPWNEGHQLQLRWDAFNVTNTQRFGAIDQSRTGFGVVRDPARRGALPPSNWSNFVQIQGQPRAMQIGARYSF